MVMATGLALSAAVLHAAWNLRVKRSTDRFLSLWGQHIAGGAFCLVLLALAGPPPLEVVPMLVASAVVHLCYVLALVHAYEAGDFSLAYPIARGGGAVLAAVGGWALLGDELAAGSWVAILLVAAGLATFVPTRSSWRPVATASLVAATVAGYTLVDSAGTRQTAGISYPATAFVGAAVLVSAWGILRGQWPSFRSAWPHTWRSHMWAGPGSALAFTLVLTAVRYAPIGYVTALRESSVLLAAAAGAVVLREPFGLARLRSAGIILAGLVLLVAVR
jgi:multidrug transporter EmrE-like cation transporter